MPIQLAIVDDHNLIISSISNAVTLTGYIEICGTYFSGEALIEGLKKTQPDVLLLDYHLPDQHGAQLARYVTYHYPNIKILALTGFDQPGLATEMLESGCKGYMLKTTANMDLIIEAINRVNDGHIYLDTMVSNKYATTIRNQKKTDTTELKLTNRELEILKNIASELSNQEIADKLFISKRTVENHRNSLIIKSGAKNTVGLIKFAIELKLI